MDHPPQAGGGCEHSELYTDPSPGGQRRERSTRRGHECQRPSWNDRLCTRLPGTCGGTCGDGDEKDRDDSGATFVSDLLTLGADYESKTDREETPLHLAARHSRADAAKCLLDKGANANSRDRLNRTPLHSAIGADAQGVFQVIKIKGLYETTTILLWSICWQSIVVWSSLLL